MLSVSKRAVLHKDVVSARPQPKILWLSEYPGKMHAVPQIRLARGDKTAHAAMGWTRVGAFEEPLAPSNVEPVSKPAFCAAPSVGPGRGFANVTNPKPVVSALTPTKLIITSIILSEGSDMGGKTHISVQVVEPDSSAVAHALRVKPLAQFFPVSWRIILY